MREHQEMINAGADILTNTCGVIIISHHVISTSTSAADAVAIGNVTVIVVDARVTNQSCKFVSRVYLTNFWLPLFVVFFNS